MKLRRQSKNIVDLRAHPNTNFTADDFGNHPAEARAKGLQNYARDYPTDPITDTIVKSSRSFKSTAKGGKYGK